MKTKTPNRTQDAQTMRNKKALAQLINQSQEDQGINQREASERTKEAQSQISLIATLKLKGFSTERLMHNLAKLGHNIEIVVSKSPTKSGKILVRAK